MTIITTAGFWGILKGALFFVARWVLGRDSVSQKRSTALAPCAPRAPLKYALRKCSTGIYIKHPSGMPVDRVFEGVWPSTTQTAREKKGKNSSFYALQHKTLILCPKYAVQHIEIFAYVVKNPYLCSRKLKFNP